MHKSYYSIKPCQNKLLQSKWDKATYDAHRKKLNEIGSVVDTMAPKTYMHMHLKLKKLRLEEDRMFIIERDNRILLEKMSNTMRTRGRIDNVNDYEEKKSLNQEKRKRELLRITKENQQIIGRIMNRQPEYNRANWQRDWHQNTIYMDNISSYPKNWWEKDDSKKKKKKTVAEENDDEEAADQKKEQENDDQENKEEEEARAEEKEVEKKEEEAEREQEEEEPEKSEEKEAETNDDDATAEQSAKPDENEDDTAAETTQDENNNAQTEQDASQERAEPEAA